VSQFTLSPPFLFQLKGYLDGSARRDYSRVRNCVCGSDASTSKLKFTPRREASLSCGQIDGYWGSPFATFRAATRLESSSSNSSPMCAPADVSASSPAIRSRRVSHHLKKCFWVSRRSVRKATVKHTPLCTVSIVSMFNRDILTFTALAEPPEKSFPEPERNLSGSSPNPNYPY
jgi:hypothetical protein